MAVSPFRALLAAHLQATWNRSTKELGKKGIVALVGLGALLVLLLALPLGGALFGAGFGLGRGWLDARNGVAFGYLLAALMGGLVLFGGFLGGALGGARQLAWERFRLYPVGLRDLYLAELGAGLGDALPLGLSFGLLAFWLGLGAAQPLLFLLLPWSLLWSVATVLSLQLVVGSLAVRAVKRLRLFLGLLGGAVWLGSVLMGTVAPRLGRRGHPDPEAVALLAGVGRGLKALLVVLPTTWVMDGAKACLQGRWGLGLALQLPAALFTFALMAWGARLMAREAEALAPTPAAKGPEKLWSFSHPVFGLARLQWHTLLSSHLGRFGFAMPLMTAVLFKGPFGQMRGSGTWGLPAAFIYLSFMGNQLLFNQWGLDRHGVKGLFLLTLRDRDLLDGKLLGYGCFHAMQAALLALFLGFLMRPAPADLLAAILLGATVFLAQGTLGQGISAWKPRAMTRNSFQGNQMPLPAVLVSLASTLGASAVFGGAWALLRWLAPAFLLPGMLLLFGLVFAVNRLLRRDFAAYLARRREAIVEAVG